MRRTIAGGAGWAGGSKEGSVGAAATDERGGPQVRAPAMRSGAVLKEEGTVPPMPPGALVKQEEVAPPPMPPGEFFKEEGLVPPLPPDAVAKQEHEVVVEERSLDGRTKRQRHI